MLSNAEETLLQNTLRGSNHPLSRSLYNILDRHDIITLDTFEEHLGSGIEAAHQQQHIKVGSAKYAMIMFFYKIGFINQI
mgnify:CR=1 FL=1